MSAGRWASLRRIHLLTLACVVAVVASLSGQSITVRAQAGALHVQAPAFSFIEGLVLDRLREGRSVRIDLDLFVLEQRDGPTVAQAQQSFALSFDLWEERFAATRIGTPPRSISHLRAKNAEAWCLESLTIPVTALGRFGRDTPFWIRLGYRMPDGTPANEDPDEPTFTLRRLIDRFSRRGETNPGRIVQAGPFRLSE